MEVTEEGNAQLAKRQAIQEIMGDPSLTAQEKQMKVQQFMAGGGRTAPPQSPEAPSPPPQAPNPSAEPQTNGSIPRPSTSRQQMMQAVMNDQSLTPQEKQQRIREIMSGNPSAAPAPAPEPAAPTPSPPQPAPTMPDSSGNVRASTSRQQMMQAVMNDPSLTPQEKQQRIREITSNNPSAAPAPEPASAPEPEPAPVAPSPVVDSRQAIQEVMGDTSLTPQERQQKIQQIMAGQGRPPATTAPSSAEEDGNASTARSSVVESGSDVTAHGRPSSSIGSAPGAVSSRGGSQEGKSSSRSVRPASQVQPREAVREQGDDVAEVPAGVGAVSSGGADPAARKSVRGSESPAAAASSRSLDPAARKIARASNRSLSQTSLGSEESGGRNRATRASRASTRLSGSSSTAAAAAAATGSVAASLPDDRMGSQRDGMAAEESMTSMQASDDGGSEMPRIGEYDDDGGYDDGGVSGGGEIEHIRNLEADVLTKTQPAVSGIPVVPPPLQEQGHYDQPGQGGPVTEFRDSRVDRPAVVDVTTEESANQERAVPVQGGPPGTSEHYAGLNYGGDIAGAETGGFEAYVAGANGDKPVVATGVQTEAELEEIDRKEQKMYFRVGVIVFCVLLVAIVVPVAIFVPGGDDSSPVNVTEAPTMAPSAPPTTSAYADLLETVRSLYGSEEAFLEAFADDDSAQSRAAFWVATESPAEAIGDAERMVSRYALATLYFATNGDDWTRCGRGSVNCDQSREWLTAPDECNWEFISCVPGSHIIEDIFVEPTADRQGNNMVGSFPSDVALLTGLKRLIIAGEKISGSIPSGWSQFTSLESLLISGNRLSGSLPSFLIDNNQMLGSIYVSGNKLTGSLPPMTSTALRDFRAEFNKVGGSIPTSIFDLPDLSILYLDNNDLSGSVPESLFNLPKLRLFRLSNNTMLSGSLTESISSLVSLEDLRAVNTGLSGNLPEGLFDLANLKRLELGKNSFSGSLSESFVQLQEIQFLSLRDNSFTGTLPTAFEGLPYLKQLELQGNDVTGAVSEGLCNRTGIKFFDISVLTVDCDEVNCTCCNNC